MKGEYWTRPFHRFGLWLALLTAVLLMGLGVGLSLWLAIDVGDFSTLAVLINPGAWVLCTLLAYEVFPGIVSKDDSLIMDEDGLNARRGKKEIGLKWDEISRVRVMNERVRLYTAKGNFCLYLRNASAVGEYIANRIPVDAKLAEPSDEALRQESVRLIRQGRRWHRAWFPVSLPAHALLLVEGLVMQDMSYGWDVTGWFIPFALISAAVSAVLFPLALACYRKARRIDERAAMIQRILEQRALENTSET